MLWISCPKGQPAINRLACQILVLISLLGTCAPVHAEDGSIGLVAGDDVVWSYRQFPAQGDQPATCKIGFGKAGSPSQFQWPPARSKRPFFGNVATAAVIGNDLHIFFNDGSFRAYSLSPNRGISTAQSILDRSLPLAVATDRTSRSIYAIVPVDVARGVAQRESDRIRRIAELRDPDLKGPEQTPEEVEDDKDGQQPTIDQLEANLLWPDATHAVVKFERGRWTVDRPMPDWFTGETPIQIAASGARIHLVTPDGSGGEHRYANSMGPEVDWSELKPLLPLSSTVDIVDLLHHDDTLHLIIRNDSDTYTTASYRDGKWIAGQPLTVAGQPLKPEPRDVAFAFTQPNRRESASRLIGIWVDGQDLVQSTMWPPEGGDAVSPVAYVPQLAPVTEPDSRDWQEQLLSFGVLGIVLGVLYWRRKTAVGTNIVIPENHRLASNSRRLAAFSLDLAIGTPVILLCLTPLFRGTAPTEEAMIVDQAVYGEAMLKEMMIRWLAAEAFFVVYATVFELLWSATPGKRIMGCRVVSETGAPAAKSRIVIRNLLKILEFYPQLIPTLILVLLTRSRQRLGDLLARTIVVEPAPPESPTDATI